MADQFSPDDRVQLDPTWWRIAGGLPAGRDLNKPGTVKNVRTQQGPRGGSEKVVDVEWDGEPDEKPYNPAALQRFVAQVLRGGGKRKKHKKRKKISKKRSSRKRTRRKSRRKRRR